MKRSVFFRLTAGLLLAGLIFVYAGCIEDDEETSETSGEKSDLNESATTHLNVNDFARSNPGSACPEFANGRRYINFAGMCWEVRSSEVAVPAGPNYYTSSANDVYVDSQGHLHMKIVFRNGKWYCSEIISTETTGYGTYVFYAKGPVHDFDKNVCLGFFTWDDNLLKAGHISEIDIELTTWGHSLWQNLHFSVQPVHGPDEESGSYGERDHSTFFVLFSDESTHGFTWRQDRIDFSSYHGNGFPTVAELGSWTFTSDNPGRRYDTGSLGVPVVIPTPTDGTHVRIDLWLIDDDNNGFGDAPSDGQQVEVEITDFQYFAL